MKSKVLWNKIKYETAIFAALAAQAAFSLYRNGGVPANFYTFYLLDYKLGFISRAFIGSAVSLLTQRVTERWLNGFILLTFLLVYILLALMLGAMLRRMPAGLKPAGVILTAVFIFTGFSVKVFIHNAGLLDIYMFLFVLLAAVCLQNKYAKWLVPLLCFAGAATHYGFIFIFFPLVFTLLLFELAKAKQKAGTVLLAAAGTVTALASSLYFMLFSNSSIKFDSAETFTYLQSKADFPVWRYFVDGILFYTDINTGRQVSGFSGFLEILKETAAEGFRMADFAKAAAMLAPLLLFFFFIWIGAFKNGKDRFEKAVFLLCMALPLPLLPWFVFSTDTPRFLAEIFVVQFAALFYMLYSQNAAVSASLKRAEAFFTKYPLLLILIFLFSLSAATFK